MNLRDHLRQRHGGATSAHEETAPSACPECGGKVAYDLTCHTYGGTGADGRERWYGCMPCDSAVEYVCVRCYEDDNPGDCDWRYTHGLNPGNPGAAANEQRRPPWIPEGQDCGEWRAPGVRMLGDD